ncbi:MAG: hypothetical protein H6909_01265 [Rickettsiaceae bacterium]|nr:hypothetical protein [Rickettsiaceae bacterium]
MTDCQNAADMQSGSDDYKNVFNEVEEEKGNKEELLASEEIATDSVNSTESWWILFCFAPLIYYSVSSLFSPVL